MDNFINGSEQEKNRLFNDCPEEFAEERELDNLLTISFENLDVSENVVSTLKSIENSPQKLSANVLKTIKQKERRKAVYFRWIALAALLAVGFVIFSLSNREFKNEITVDSTFEIDNSRVVSGTNLNGKGSATFNRGVVIDAKSDVSVTYNDNDQNFLFLHKGELDVKVESRSGKSPLFFEMPHGVVKITGTEFKLISHDTESKVVVTEGSVEFISNGKTTYLYSGEEASSRIPQSKSKVTKFSFNDLKEGITFKGKPQISEGLIGNALLLDGNTKGEITRSFEEEESFSFWYKTDRVTEKGESIIGQHDFEHSFNGFHIYSHRGLLQLQLKDAETSSDHTLFIKSNDWNHIVFCRKTSGAFKMFVNGEQITHGIFPYKYNSNKLYICSPDTHWLPFKGKLDELQIFNRFLTLDDVQKLYQKKSLEK